MLARLNAIARRLITDVDLYLAQEIAVIPWLKRDEGLATVVLRVAQIFAKSVPLERQAFNVGLDEDKPQAPTVAPPDWRDLFERAGIRERSEPCAD